MKQCNYYRADLWVLINRKLHSGGTAGFSWVQNTIQIQSLHLTTWNVNLTWSVNSREPTFFFVSGIS